LERSIAVAASGAAYQYAVSVGLHDLPDAGQAVEGDGSELGVELGAVAGEAVC
jgi:hypothetical protein